MNSVFVHLPLFLLILSCLFTPSFGGNFPRDHASIEISLVTKGVGASRQYLAQLQVGKPPQTLYLIADTGSSATWVYCDRLPCHEDNYSYSPRIFDPSRSSTFTPLPCSSSHAHCNFTAEYEDGSSTSGYWANETVTIRSNRGSEARLSNVTIGCSSGDSTNVSDAVDGILGLSPSWPSFTSHLARKDGMKYFSYILSGAEKATSNHDLLIFGDTESYGINRELLQYADLVPSAPEFYYVAISDIFVDDTRLDIPSSVWEFDDRNGSGGVVLDTGTVLTYVPRVAFEAIHAAYAEFLQLFDNVKVTETMACFDSLVPEFAATKFPQLTIEFGGGAQLSLDEDNLFYEDDEGFRCLAVQAVEDGEGSIIGNTLQRGYFWEYDLLNRRVGFVRPGW